jgi:hypothetical protein
MLAKFAAKQSRSAARGDAGEVDSPPKAFGADPPRRLPHFTIRINRTSENEIDRPVCQPRVADHVLFAIVVLSLVLVVGNIFRKLLPLLVNHDVPMEYLLTFIAYVLPFSLIFTIP